ncbi:arsenate-mycothiol transferase ArsC [Janibacter sp. Soil728]|uniref:arsenate-mycothiol transferase ArsC n=1 Tax=Janibacter sp. Soil728 TaxID=1736393 RepID=UPI0012E8D45D|nr:arsenate reductase ArsC [Janibacter sp. Soil728]
MTDDRAHEYRRITDDLADRFEGLFTRDEVDEIVADSRAQLERTATIDTYLPVFVARFAKERLGAAARDRGGSAKGVHRILFVCNGNAGRSQMAAAFAEAVGGQAVIAASAGINPMASLLPEVRTAMTEKGIELPEAFPKPVTREVTSAMEVVVGIGLTEQELPEAQQVVTWDISAVVGRSPQEVRVARDDIEARVRDLIGDLVDDGELNHSSGDAHRSR